VNEERNTTTKTARRNRLVNGKNHKWEQQNHLSTRSFDVGANSLQKAQGPSGHNIRSIIRILERNAHMRLGSQVIYLIRTDRIHPLPKSRSIGEISIVKLHPGRGVVGINVDVI
jgi:hypothetical protein